MPFFRTLLLTFYIVAVALCCSLSSGAQAQHIEQLYDENSTLDLSDSLY
jgi:two-component system sensor histidine kinase BarA